MRFVILTGMSGAGKSTVIKFFEDIGYFCVDNLPPTLIPKFIELCKKPNSEISKVAIGIDIRGGKLFKDLFTYLSEIKNEKNACEILFLDASDEVLLRRYKETRRVHPLSKGDRLIKGILKERELLKEIRTHADYTIDTSYILTRDLKKNINDIFLEDKEFKNIIVNILSFGFKYGLPQDADLIFDVRFLPNPFYIEELKYLTGNDAQVKEYVMNFDESKIFLEKLNDMISFLLPNYIKEGKNQLVIGIGCTGGKHRSVTLTNNLFSKLKDKKYSVVRTHRDIDKDINK